MAAAVESVAGVPLYPGAVCLAMGQSHPGFDPQGERRAGPAFDYVSADRFDEVVAHFQAALRAAPPSAEYQSAAPQISGTSADRDGAEATFRHQFAEGHLSVRIRRIGSSGSTVISVKGAKLLFPVEVRTYFNLELTFTGQKSTIHVFPAYGNAAFLGRHHSEERSGGHILRTDYDSYGVADPPDSVAAYYRAILGSAPIDPAAPSGVDQWALPSDYGIARLRVCAIDHPDPPAPFTNAAPDHLTLITYWLDAESEARFAPPEERRRALAAWSHGHRGVSVYREVEPIETHIDEEQAANLVRPSRHPSGLRASCAQRWHAPRHRRGGFPTLAAATDRRPTASSGRAICPREAARVATPARLAGASPRSLISRCSGRGCSVRRCYTLRRILAIPGLWWSEPCRTSN